MKLYSFPSISQFRSVVKNVNDRCEYHKLTEKPKLKFSGTVKLHGTNAGVVVTKDGEIYAQSKNNILTADADNAGFAVFVEANKLQFLTLARAITADSTIVLYGEWCGIGIQKSVAISNVSKRFILFAACYPLDDTNLWLTPRQLKTITASSSLLFDEKINSIYNYQTWEIEIDFSNLATAQNTLVDITNAVELECPVGKALGFSGVGEGVVWTCDDVDYLPFCVSDLVFKVKGDKHSETKTINLAPIDIERFNQIKELTDSLITEHRLEKGIDQLMLDNPGKDIFDMSLTPQFLKRVGQDVLKEETDTIVENGFDPKEVTKLANRIARDWFKQQVDSN